MINTGRVLAKIEFSAVAIPRAHITLNEAVDKWLAANKDNKVLDDGGRSDPRLVVGRERSRTVAYEVEGASVDDAIKHMRAIGLDVRGQGPQSGRGLPTIIVSENY